LKWKIRGMKLFLEWTLKTMYFIDPLAIGGCFYAIEVATKEAKIQNQG
jgi:hypothetical protein